MTIETYEMINGEKTNHKTFLINLNGTDNTSKENKSSNVNLSSVTTLSTQLGYQNTFSNYEYTFYTGNMWELRRPDGSFGTYYFRTYKNTTNGTSIENFRNKVNSVNSLEGKLIAASSMSVLTSVLSVIATVITGGAAGTGAYAALGLVGAALYYAVDLQEACVNANYYYWEVYNNSSIFY